MFRFILGFLLIASSFSILYSHFPVDQYLKPKQVRLYNDWQKDISKLSQNQQFADMLSQISNVEIHFTDPDIAEEFDDFRAPFKEDKTQSYLLKISITRWIDQNRYGFVVQHELFDDTENKIYEFISHRERRRVSARR